MGLVESMGDLHRRMCLAWSPAGYACGCMCTLALGHAPPHVAHGPDNEPVMAWTGGPWEPSDWAEVEIPRGSKPAL